MNSAAVSIIIPTYGSTHTLNHCLKSIAYQVYDNMEVIIVDGSGEVDVSEIAAKYGASYFRVKADRHRARLYGVKRSKGEYILFVDDDHILDRELVSSCVAVMNKGFDALKIKEVFVGRNLIAKASAYWKNRVIRNELHDPGIPRFYRKELILNYAEDEEINFWEDLLTYRSITGRKKLKIGWCEKPLYHFEPELLSSYARKYYRYGKAYARLQKTPFKEEATREKLLLTMRVLLDVIKNPGSESHLLAPCMVLLAVKSTSFLIGTIRL